MPCTGRRPSPNGSDSDKIPLGSETTRCATSESEAARIAFTTLNDIVQSLKSRITAMARSGASGIAGNKETVRTERSAEAAPQ
jgi:hypothetical protein